MLDIRRYIKVISPRLIAKALVSMDKSTALVVSACWLSAFATLIFAVIAVHSAVAAKKEAATASVAEPVLPKVAMNEISPRDAQLILDRLKHQFPDIKFDTGINQSVVIRSSEGAKFHQWITALSYIDTMEPRLHWSMSEFCVGACNSGQDLMRAVVVAKRVVFSLPQP